jgi:hypothetical protein
MNRSREAPRKLLGLFADQIELPLHDHAVQIRTLILAVVVLMAFTSACGDSSTPPPGIEPPVSFRLVVSPVRDPEEKTEVQLDRIDHVAVIAIRPPEGPIDLRVEESVDPRLSVMNLTGEEIVVSLFRDNRLVSEGPLPDDETEFFGDSS